MPRYPYADPAPAIAERIASLGGQPLNLYRVLGNQPSLLSAWVEFAYSLRRDCQSPRPLRELMILRTAQMMQSAYEWHQHKIMARGAGVSEVQMAELATWRDSDTFDAREKAALRLTEAIVAGQVDDEAHRCAAALFSPAEMIELVLTAGFYCMVPRVLSALAVTSDGEPGAPSASSAEGGSA
jgi:alkylhydroperoxidase family enzyme